MRSSNRAPDWQLWVHVPTVTLHEGVALSLNIDPKRLRRPTARAIMAGKHYDEGPEFDRRLELAKRCLGDSLPGPENWVAVRYFDETMTVGLWNFATWARSVGWPIPPELEQVGAGKDYPAVEAADPDPNERLTLPEQVRRLARAMPQDRARQRVEKAFLFREIRYQPEFTVSYDDARINWQTGVVVLRRLPRQPFTPTLSAAEFFRHFMPATVAAAPAPLKAPTAREPVVEPSQGTTNDDDADARSGLPGRPGKSRHLIEDELRRRINAGEVLQSLADEAVALLAWLTKTHPRLPRPTAKTIQNNIRADHRRWQMVHVTKRS